MASLLGLTLLVGCQSSWKPPEVRNTDDSLPTRVARTSDAAMIRQIGALEKKGVTVITMGQNYLISIPCSRLFANQSPRLLWEAYDTLNAVVAYLGEFRKIAVTVTAYGDTYNHSERREIALSKARASFVSNYLWSQGVDTRMLISRGAGPTNPIVLSGSQRDQSSNSRIEITFRDEVA